MPRKYNISSKSDMRRLIRDMQKDVKKAVAKEARSTSYTVNCPHCLKKIKLKPGQNHCPYCQNFIRLNIQL